MSNSSSPTKLPEATIPDERLWTDNPNFLIDLMKALTAFAGTMRDVIHDMMTFTDSSDAIVANCWRECRENIVTIRLAWYRPILGTLSSLHYLRQQAGVPSYSHQDIVSYDDALKKLTNMDICLAKDERQWREKNKDLFRAAQASLKESTARLVPEILFNALLVTRRARFSSERDVLAPQLDPKGELPIPKTFRWGTKDDPTEDVADRMRTPIGYPACMAALFTKGKLTTGATLAKFGPEIHELEVTSNGVVATLESNHRERRQARFNGKEQKLLNGLMNPAVEYLKDQRKKLDKEWSGDAEMRKTGAATYMIGATEKILPPCLHKISHSQVGQAYIGKNLLPKAACPFCETVYRYFVVHAGGPKDDNYWKSLPELSRQTDKRGCCAEALTFVLGLQHRDKDQEDKFSLKILENELYLSPGSGSFSMRRGKQRVRPWVP